LPKYDYKCSACDTVYELQRSMFDESSVTCPKCGSQDAVKLMSAPASVLDWRISESVHNSQRNRAAVVNRQVRRLQHGQK
jgi:putative FmdB family regulatory protein